MFKKSDKGYYFWEEFAENDGIVHGFSIRKFGDMNIKNPNSYNNLKLFIRSLGINNKNVIRMDQVHENNVCFVSSEDNGKIIEACDGLVSSDANVFLIGTFADCVPILFLDKDKKIFGIAHAGWKGVYKEVVKVMVGKLVEKGAMIPDIMVGLGPSIRVCCYDVYKNRVEVFKKKFSKMRRITEIKDHKIFLDLIKIVKLQLKDCGILDQNILDCKICTKHNMSDFYSYRGEHGKSSFGLSAAVIGRI